LTKIKLNISDARMLQLIIELKDQGAIRFTQQFCDDLEIHKQHIRQIRIGKQHFTAEQIKMACKEYNVNANWIIGLEENIYRRKLPNKLVIMKRPQTKTQTKMIK